MLNINQSAASRFVRERKTMNIKLTDPNVRIYCASMGKLFRATAIARSAEEANAISERDSKQLVIAESRDGLVFLAEQYGAVCPSAVLADVDRANL